MENKIQNQLKTISLTLPENVNCYQSQSLLLFQGIKGVSSISIDKTVTLTQENQQIFLTAKYKYKNHQNTAKRLIQNALIDVQFGNFLVLRLQGSSYGATVENNLLILNIGFSHPVYYNIPPTVRIKSSATTICIYGTNKAEVSRVANEISSIRPPDVYKGKGIVYFNQTLRILTPKTKK